MQKPFRSARYLLTYRPEPEPRGFLSLVISVLYHGGYTVFLEEVDGIIITDIIDQIDGRNVLGLFYTSPQRNPAVVFIVGVLRPQFAVDIIRFIFDGAARCPAGIEIYAGLKRRSVNADRLDGGTRLAGDYRHGCRGDGPSDFVLPPSP